MADEREHAIFYLAEILYRIVPAFYEEIAAALGKLYGTSPESLELPVIVRFGTWVGGDMESSATCTPRASARPWRARSRSSSMPTTKSASSWRRRCRRAPAASVCRAAVMRRIEEYRTLLPGAHGIAPSRHDRMPYRVLLGQIAERLHATYDGRSNGYQQPAQFRADIDLIAQSLLANRGAHAGYFQVRRLLYRIDTFGFHLATLDLRAQRLGASRGAGAGSGRSGVGQAQAAERHARLVEILERDIGPSGTFDALGKRTLAVFDAILQSRHRYGADSVGLYIVGGAAAGRRYAGTAGAGALGRRL